MQVHLSCVNRCLGARTIEQRCVVCQVDIDTSTIRRVVQLVKELKRKEREREKEERQWRKKLERAFVPFCLPEEWIAPETTQSSLTAR